MTRFYYVLYSNKTWNSEQLERPQGTIYIVIAYNVTKFLMLFSVFNYWMQYVMRNKTRYDNKKYIYF